MVAQLPAVDTGDARAAQRAWDASALDRPQYVSGGTALWRTPFQSGWHADMGTSTSGRAATSGTWDPAGATAIRASGIRARRYLTRALKPQPSDGNRRT